MSEILDLLLSAECPDVRRTPPEKRVEIVSLSRRIGKPAIFTIRALPYGKVQEMRRLNEESTNLRVILAGCVDPNWKDERLLDKEAGIVTATDAIESRLLVGEISELASEIEKLSGFRQNTIREVKND